MRCDPRAQLLLAARVGEREHRLQVRDLRQLADRLAADALGRRVGRQQVGVLGLQRAQLVEQRVVFVVADLGVVEDVVAVVVVLELLAQLGGPLLAAAGALTPGLSSSTSCAAGSSSRAEVAARQGIDAGSGR